MHLTLKNSGIKEYLFDPNAYQPSFIVHLTYTRLRTQIPTLIGAVIRFRDA
jgi:hypothetical protein